VIRDVVLRLLFAGAILAVMLLMSTSADPLGPPAIHGGWGWLASGLIFVAVLLVIGFRIDKRPSD
jgi:hypothetical protein